MKKLHFCLICSPSAGILDNWIPVLDRMRDLNRNIKFTIIFPAEETINSLKSDNILSVFANRIFENCIVQSRCNNFYKFDGIFDGINNLYSVFLKKSENFHS